MTLSLEICQEKRSFAWRCEQKVNKNQESVVNLPATEFESVTILNEHFPIENPAENRAFCVISQQKSSAEHGMRALEKAGPGMGAKRTVTSQRHSKQTTKKGRTCPK